VPHPQPHPLGRRIHVMGNSASGKSSLGAALAERLAVPFVELDALNWLPGWVGLNATDPDAFEQRIREATAGDAWVVAGSYSRFSQNTFWDRLDTLVWLDLPMPQLVWRMLCRSWRRWRRQELLWGTNVEPFWPQLMFWRGEESLLWWIVTQHERKRRTMLAWMLEPRWSHIRFIRLTTSKEITRFQQALPGAAPSAT
jgi:adenylate kinase family enzyme